MELQRKEFHPLRGLFVVTLDFSSVLRFLLEGLQVASAFLSLPWFVGSRGLNPGGRVATALRVEEVGFEISYLLLVLQHWN